MRRDLIDFSLDRLLRATMPAPTVADAGMKFARRGSDYLPWMSMPSGRSGLTGISS
jgi:hypothetical protein